MELEADESLGSTLQRDAAQSEILLAESDARTARYRRQLEAVQGAIAAKRKLKAAEARLQERRSALGFRGERPSFPNIELNAGIALFAAVVLSALYIALELSYTAQRAEYHRRSMGR